MRFGLFYELQLPRPWSASAERELFRDALEQVELADRLGIEYVWAVEHHFLEEYSHSSAPEIFLAAASQRTRDIRLGHGIVQTAPLYNHPVRTAERIASLDLVSNGRVEFGSGESSSIAELDGFRIDPAQKRAMWREGLEVAIRCLTESPFTGHDGKYVSVPPRNVVPKPLQQPHPPLWLACSQRDTIRLAAASGMGALAFSFIDPDQAASWVREYEAALAESCVPVGKSVTCEIACVTPMMLHRDEREAIARGGEGASFFGYSLAHYYLFGDCVPGAASLWDAFQERRARAVDTRASERARSARRSAEPARSGGASPRGAIGTPRQLRAHLLGYEAAGVDQIIFIVQAGKNRHPHIMESLELFAAEVLPEFAERDPKQRAAKRARLEPAIERALARRVDAAPALPAGYRLPALAKPGLLELGGEALLERIAVDTATGRSPDTAIDEELRKKVP
ncbi:MAG TPA: LLM class flavin-dependent oxidoreductase [Myxococcota bacterium]|nr:LLM class flavin-dependent oxidoreductase [Myxococcota bacterium]